MQKETPVIGVSFGGAIAIAFIILKLCHVINWSWLWVLAPLWIPVALVVIAIIIILLLARK